MIKKQAIVLAVSASMVLSLAGCGEKQQEAPQTEAEADATNVTVCTIGTEYLQNTVSYTGELKASDSTSNTSKVSARITKVNVDEGDYVKAGDVLAELDATDITNAYNSALAGYNSALASYNSVVNSATRQASTNAVNSYNSAQLAYNQAVRNYNREKELYESGSTLKLAQQAYDDALAAYNREKELYNNDTALVSARNNLATAEKNLNNLTELYNVGAVSKFDYDNAVANVENLRASLESLTSQKQAAYDTTYSALVKAEENLNTTRLNESASFDAAKNALDNAANSLDTARENIGLTQVSNESSVATASASLESARNSLNTAADNLNNTKVRALSSGYIASKNATVGQMAAAGAELFSIKNTNSVMAEIEVTESVIPFIRQGVKAIVDVQSAGMENIEGTVSLVNPTKDAKTGMYTVQVDIPNTDNKLNIGMFADVTLAIQESADALTVPNDAILQEGESFYVYTASPDGATALKKLITTGIESDDYTEVVSGLNIGDRVIVTGQDYLSDENNAIKIVTE